MKILAVSVLCVGTLSGCYRAGLIQPEAIEMYPESEILVLTKDGRKFGFGGHEHIIVTQQNGSKAIRGKAKLFRDYGPQFEWFEGEIRFNDIMTITTPEKTSFYYVPFVLIGVAILIGILFASTITQPFGG